MNGEIQPASVKLIGGIQLANPEKTGIDFRKHDVSFIEPMTPFGDSLSMNMPDPDHSEDEQPFIMLGASDRYRLRILH